MSCLIGRSAGACLLQKLRMLPVRSDRYIGLWVTEFVTKTTGRLAATVPEGCIWSIRNRS